MHERRYRIGCWGGIGAVSAVACIMIIVLYTSCTPFSAFWTGLSPVSDGRCTNPVPALYGNAAFSMVSDIFICMLPIRLVRSLRLPRVQKLAMMLIFTIASIGCIASALRIAFLYCTSTARDPTHWSIVAAITAAVETNLAIVCACLPTLPPLSKYVKSAREGFRRMCERGNPHQRTSTRQEYEEMGVRKNSVTQAMNTARGHLNEWANNLEKDHSTRYQWSVTASDPASQSDRSFWKSRSSRPSVTMSSTLPTMPERSLWKSCPR